MTGGSTCFTCSYPVLVHVINKHFKSLTKTHSCKIAGAASRTNSIAGWRDYHDISPFSNICLPIVYFEPVIKQSDFVLHRPQRNPYELV